MCKFHLKCWTVYELWGKVQCLWRRRRPNKTSSLFHKVLLTDKTTQWLQFPFPIYNKSIAEVFENIWINMCKISINEKNQLPNKLKILWQRRNCSLSRISPYATMFLNSFFCRGVGKCLYVEKGYIPNKLCISGTKRNIHYLENYHD